MPHRPAPAYGLVAVLALLLTAGATGADAAPQPTVLRGVAAVAAVEGGSACASASPAVQDRAPGAGRRTVALTFDDGPGSATPEVLRILARNHVRATFFMLGIQVRRFPELARAVVAAGHLVGNHTYDHASLRRTGRDVDLREIRRTDALLAGIGAPEVCVFRAPGGGTSPALLRVAHEEGLAVWGWTASSGDAEQPLRAGAATRWVSRIVRGSTSRHAHPVVLLHDGRGDLRTGRQYPQASTVAALQRVITWYAARGYDFVGLDGRS